MKYKILLLLLLVALSANSLRADGTLITLDLSQPSTPASFEMAANRIWRHTYNNNYPHISFNGGTFTLTHLVDRDGFGSENEWGYWDGFTYSKDGDNTNFGAGDSQSWVAHQFGNMAGGGIKTDAAGNVLRDGSGKVIADRDVPYLVAYWGYYKLMWGTSDKQPLQVSLDKTYRAVGIYVNNHPWPFYGNNGGDSFARPLNRDGDYFTLTIHGLDAGLRDNGKTVVHDLARNTGGTLTQSPDWEWVDLSALGDIGGLYFTMEGSDTDPIVGINTAAYFCIDKLTVGTPQTGTPDIPVSGVSLSRTSAALTAGDALQLSANVLPANATNKAVSWTSSNTSVATVSASGRVSALSAGQASITARTADGNFTASCAVTVTDPAPGTVAVTGVSLNRTSATVKPGEMLQLAAAVTPANATNKAVTWTSSNEDVALVTVNGLVVTASEGTATVTVRTADGSFTATCAVTVSNTSGTEAVAAALPQAYCVSDNLRLLRLEGYACTVISPGGRQLRSFRVASPDETRPLALPAGIYILSAEKNGVRKTFKIVKR